MLRLLCYQMPLVTLIVETAVIILDILESEQILRTDVQALKITAFVIVEISLVVGIFSHERFVYITK